MPTLDPKDSAHELLPVLYEEIGSRCREVAEARPTWPCRRGCDHCCRNLAEPLRLPAAEWRQIEEGLAALDAESRADVEARLKAVASTDTGPVICPFLELGDGACRVYAHRPTACRTYGYYQSRDGGNYCRLVEGHVGDPDPETPWESAIVWGSQEAVDRRLEARLGPAIPLRQWLESRRLEEP